jgi:hypothetical protein
MQVKEKKMWIKSQQNGALVNLDNIADITVKKDSQGLHSLMAYTTTGFGVVVYKGSSSDCEERLDMLNVLTSAREI